MEPLKGAALAELQASFHDTRLLIIDEYSMLGCTSLHYLNERCKEVICNDRLFGGLVALFSGDPMQLDTIGDTPLYGKPKPTEAIAGSLIYRNRKNVIQLVIDNRTLEGEHEHKRLLRHLGFGGIDYNDWNYLSKRQPSYNVQEDMKDFVHLYPTKAEAARTNMERLSNLNSYIC